MSATSKPSTGKSKLFGTDGIRGMANQYPITSEVIMQVGRATGHVIRSKIASDTKRRRKARILIGKDTRISGYMIEMALASGICSMGVDVLLIGPMPTPGIAFLTQSMRCDAGIQISASHNAFHDNGIKIFAEDGFKIPDSIESEIERLVHSGELDKFRPTAENVGKAFRIEDALGRYIVQLKNTFPRDLTLEGVRIVLDCANGAFYKGAPLVFEELGAEVIKRGVNPTGLNINDKVGALYPENVAAAAVEYRADLGVSLDGDGDRVVLADETGAVVDGDQIMAICALEMQREGTLNKDTLVVTPMSNIGLELGLAQHGIKVIRAQVGDRYVVDTMRKGDYSLGGEQSGHIVLLEHAKTGDGVVAALKVLAIMQRTGKKLSELKKCITLYPQVRHDVRITRREPLDQLKEVQDEIKAAEKALQNKGRVFVRLSGTEPLARVLVEGENASEISHFAQRIGASIHKALG